MTRWQYARMFDIADSVKARRMGVARWARVTMPAITPTGRLSKQYTSAVVFGDSDGALLLQRAYCALAPHTLRRGYTWGEPIAKVHAV